MTKHSKLALSACEPAALQSTGRQGWQLGTNGSLLWRTCNLTPSSALLSSVCRTWPVQDQVEHLISLAGWTWCDSCPVLPHTWNPGWAAGLRLPAAPMHARPSCDPGDPWCTQTLGLSGLPAPPTPAQLSQFQSNNTQHETRPHGQAEVGKTTTIMVRHPSCPNAHKRQACPAVSVGHWSTRPTSLHPEAGCMLLGARGLPCPPASAQYASGFSVLRRSA